MIETIKELKEKRPDLVEDFGKMSKKQLYDQLFKECKDAINMEERVQLFMNECTNLSKTTYTIESIKTLISEKQEQDISEFCKDLIEDVGNMSKEDILKYIQDKIID